MKRIRTATKSKKWPKYCLVAAIGLLLLAGTLYLIYCQDINSEFGHTKDYFGEQFDELYSLNTPDSDISEPVLAKGRAALAFIGTEEEREAFGVLSHYCTSLKDFPEAVSSTYTLDLLAGNTGDAAGYLWVAYTRYDYDADGNIVRSSGSSDERILARWTIKKIDGVWTVTEVSEHP